MRITVVLGLAALKVASSFFLSSVPLQRAPSPTPGQRATHKTHVATSAIGSIWPSFLGVLDGGSAVDTNLPVELKRSSARRRSFSRHRRALRKLKQTGDTAPRLAVLEVAAAQYKAALEQVVQQQRQQVASVQDGAPVAFAGTWTVEVGPQEEERVSSSPSFTLAGFSFRLVMRVGAEGEGGVRQLGAFLLYEGPTRATTPSPTSTSSSSSSSAAEWAWAEGQLSAVPRVQVEFRRADKPKAPSFRSQPVAFSSLHDRLMGLEQWSEVRGRRRVRLGFTVRLLGVDFPCPSEIRRRSEQAWEQVLGAVESELNFNTSFSTSFNQTAAVGSHEESLASH